MHSLAGHCARTCLIAAHKASLVCAAALRSRALSLAKNGSIGLRSGLSGGRSRRLAQTAVIASLTPATLCNGRLSITTTADLLNERVVRCL
jgi:hypothetical protein